MNPRPSFERLNYLLRPNKHIERKFVFDVLRRVSGHISFQQHRYLGLGSVWFADFVIAHRHLGLQELWSIEFDEFAGRAEFNSPYRSVVVKPGRSTDVLQSFGNQEWQRPIIAWLDYDGPLDKEVLRDVELLTQNSRPNSVLIVTLNARFLTYKPRGGDPGNRITAFRVIEELTGADVVDASFRPGITQGGQPLEIAEDVFPRFLADTLLNVMGHKVAVSGRLDVRFVPLFNICHVDGAEMVTVGGAITPEGDADHWRRARRAEPLVGGDGERPSHLRLDLVPITLKEKYTLDRCLPDAPGEFLHTAKVAGLRLDEDQLKKYASLYCYFPVFAETTL